jgi:hypothetical protein
MESSSRVLHDDESIVGLSKLVLSARRRSQETPDVSGGGRTDGKRVYGVFSTANVGLAC